MITSVERGSKTRWPCLRCDCGLAIVPDASLHGSMVKGRCGGCGGSLAVNAEALAAAQAFLCLTLRSNIDIAWSARCSEVGQEAADKFVDWVAEATLRILRGMAP